MRSSGQFHPYVGGCHLLQLREASQLETGSTVWRSAMVETYEAGATIFAGIAMGPVWLIVEEWNEEPELDPADWDYPIQIWPLTPGQAPSLGVIHRETNPNPGTV